MMHAGRLSETCLRAIQAPNAAHLSSHGAHAIRCLFLPCVQHPEFTFKSKLLKKVTPYVFPPDLPPSDLAAAKVSDSVAALCDALCISWPHKLLCSLGSTASVLSVSS